MNIRHRAIFRLSLTALMLSVPTLVWAAEQKIAETSKSTMAQKQVDTSRPSYKACMDKSEGITVSMRDCAGTELEYQDNRLNRAYRTLRTKLKQSSAMHLRDEQRAWIAERDQQCAVDKDGGTAALIVADDCLIQVTSERAIELEKQIPR
jgi:uncharacterized protein YecT (DUF1311 family)